MDNFNDSGEYDRLNKVTKEQKRKLMDLTEKGRKCLDMFKTAQYRNQKEWWWRKTSAILNSMPGLGAVKTAKQWEKTYKDIKMYARKKAVNMNSVPMNMESSEGNDGLFVSRVDLINQDEVTGTLITESTEFNGQEHAYSFPHTISNDPMIAQNPGAMVHPLVAPISTYSDESYPNYYNVPPTSSTRVDIPEMPLPDPKPKTTQNIGKVTQTKQKRKMKRFPDVFPSHNTSLSGESLEECKTFLDNKISLLERIARAQESQARVALDNAKHFETFVGLVGRLLDKN